MAGLRTDFHGCRILMYSHDTFGLGHLTRTLRIASAIQDSYERTSVLILTGSPVAPYLPLPPRTDMVKLPTVLKKGADHYESRDLDIDFRQLRTMRREVIRSTAKTFRPHVFMVDNVPLGMKGEIIPTLEMLRRNDPETKIILNLRDILDDAVTVRKSWARDDVLGAFDRFYDRIYVLGDPSIYDAVDEYGLPADRTQFVGYATPGPRVSFDGKGHSEKPADRTAARVLVTAGGGGDGYPMLAAALAAASRVSERRIELEVVTGPLMDAEARRSLLQMAGASGALIHEFVGDLPRRMAEVDLVVAMAGYNTCCEILSHARSVLLYPRTTPRLEQKLRADAFMGRGLATTLVADDLDPDAMAIGMAEALVRGCILETATLPRLEGQYRIAKDLAEFFPDLLDVSQRVCSRTEPGAEGWSALMRTIPDIPRSLAGLRDAWIPDLPVPSSVNLWPGSVVST